MVLSADIVMALVKTIELKDQSTAAHTWRVVLYTRMLAETHGLSNAEILRLSVGAALHDVGKIDIPDEILQKPGKLTSDEFAVMQQHTTLGHERLVRMGETDPLILDLVRFHHERVNGLGYPDRLSGTNIPLAARFFGVVDTFDALTSVRPYRAEVGIVAGEHAVDELRRGIGTHYEHACVEALAELFESGRLGWIMEHFNDRCELPPFGCPNKAAEVAHALRR